MNRKTKERIDDLDKTVAYYMDKVEKLEESQREIKEYIKKCVWESMQSWLSSGHRNIVTMVNDKVVTTQYIRDEVRELNEKKIDLELTLERVNETLNKCKGEK